MAMQRSQEGAGLPFYVYLVDLPPDTYQPRNTDAIYTLYIEDDSDSDLETVCEVTRSVALTGVVGYVPRASGAGTVSGRTLTEADHPRFDALCRGLAMPLSSLIQNSGANSSADGSDLKVYDYLSHNMGLVMMVLMPGRLQGQDTAAALTRYYWAGALGGRYRRIPNQADLANDPRTYQQIASMGPGRPANFQISIPGTFLSGEGVNAYPREARQEFGERIDRLDADWLAYLTHAAVTIRDRRTPFMNGAQPIAILPTFSASEMGTPAFWLAANDMMRANEMVSCLAGRFLSSRYHVEASQFDLGRCAIEEMFLQPD
jgi:hypothetical protein